MQQSAASEMKKKKKCLLFVVYLLGYMKSDLYFIYVYVRLIIM